MHRSRFELSERPFLSVPQTDRYFPGALIEEARERLVRCIERIEGPALLIGPAGVGKSLLCLVLADHFRSELAIVHLASARICSRRALLQVILFELGLPYREMEEGELRLSLIDRLAAPGDDRPGMLLLVDEAHNMPFALLEEMRMITNLVRDGQPRVRLVMAGLPSLEERFANPKLESFNQRLAARCYLGAFNRVETAQYVRAQIAASQGNPDELLTADAFEAVYHATDGVPRLINQLCDQALLSASMVDSGKLSGADIEAAWAELQQLPTPWCGTSPGPTPTSEGVIEFGNLDDLPIAGETTEDVAEIAVERCDEDVAATAIEVATDGDAVAGSGPEWELTEEQSTEPHSAADDTAEFVPAGTIGFERIGADQDLGKLDATAEDAPPEISVAAAEGLEGSVSGGDADVIVAGELAECACVGAAVGPADPVDYNPFEESYDDEEVVIDQYSSLACDIFRQQPRVVSRESGMPLHLLREIDHREQHPSLSLVEETTGVETSHEAPAVAIAAERFCPSGPDAAAVVEQITDPPETEELVVCRQDNPRAGAPMIDLMVTPAAAVVTVDTLAEPPAAETTEVDAGVDADVDAEVNATAVLGEAELDELAESDVIVIDDQDDTATDDDCAAAMTPVRAGQYDQLFTRLRRA